MNTSKSAELSTTHTTQNSASHQQQKKKNPTDIQLCAYIIFVFYHYPNKGYLTTDEMYAHLSTFVEIDKERLEKVLFELATSWIIKHTSYGEPNIKTEKRWHWSIRMAEKDGEEPTHSGFKWHNSNETLQ